MASRKEGLAILEATCKLNGIDSEWLKESVNNRVKSCLHGQR